MLTTLVLLAFHAVIAPFCIVHALVYKRDHRAALGWVAVAILFPVAGPLLYLFFGVNRLRHRARQLTGRRWQFLAFGYERGQIRPPTVARLAGEHPLAQAGWSTTAESLLDGNSVELLINGDAFYPRLIESINAAERQVWISSYIFSGKGVGADIAAALRRASKRGVECRVLIDGVGSLYSTHGIDDELAGSKVKVAKFLPPRLLPPSLHINLRNHRKIAVIDGDEAFFGGLNIDDRHFVSNARTAEPQEDLHFRVTGPICGKLAEVFASDWLYACGERLQAAGTSGQSRGKVRCRVIEDGPDESLDRLVMTLAGVISGAQRRLQIMTPYFIPGRELTAIIQAAAVRGVRVQLLLPAHSNLRFVDWASRHLLWEFAQWGVEIRFKPAPFAHTKLLIVDEDYVLGGSANMDARSLRLNFEIGVEMFDRDVAEQAGQVFERAWWQAEEVTLERLDRRSLPARVRDGFFWLFSAYL